MAHVLPTRRTTLFVSDNREIFNALVARRSNLLLQVGIEEYDSSDEDDDLDETPIEPSDLINLNVGGTIFTTSKKTLEKNPIPKFGNLDRYCENYVVRSNSYYFAHSPTFFPFVLEYLKYGYIHVPRNVCIKEIDAEMEYWGVENSKMATCCNRHFSDSLADLYYLETLIKKPKNKPPRKSCFINLKNLSEWKGAIWTFLSEQHWGGWSKVWESFYLAMITLSVVVMIMSTNSSFRSPLDIQINSNGYCENVTFCEDLVSDRFTEHMETTAVVTLKVLDLFCLIFFTLEFFVRCYVCPSLKTMAVKIDTILDVLFLLPSWVNSLISLINADVWYDAGSLNVPYAYIFVKFMMVFRIARLTRCIRNNHGLQAIVKTIKASRREINLMFSFVLTLSSVIAFSIYCAELLNISEYDNVFIGIWWSIVTITSVGYGDYYPENWPGYSIGIVCAIVGLVFIIVPVPIVLSNFQKYYAMHVNIERHEKIMKSEMVTTVKNESDAK